MRAFLAAVEAARSRRIEIEIAAWSIDGEPESVATRWTGPPTAGLRRLCVGSGAVRVDAVRAFECVRGEPLVLDWVAQRALRKGEFAHDPQMGVVEGGLRVLVSASPLGDATDAILVSAAFAFGSCDGAPRAAPSGLAGTPEHDVVEIAAFSGWMRGRLQSGEALAAWSLGDAGAGPRVAVSVRARWLDPAPVVPKLGVLPVGALSAARFRTWYGEELWSSLESLDLAEDLARAAAAPEGTIVAPFGQHLVVIGDLAARERIAAELSSRIAAWTEPIAIECVTRAADGRVRHRVVVSSLASAPVWFHRGQQSRRAVGHALETGMGVFGPMPTIATVSDGVTLRGVLQRSGERFFASLGWRARAGSRDARAAGRRGTSALELGPVSIDDARYDAAIERGESVPLGAMSTLTIR